MGKLREFRFEEPIPVQLPKYPSAHRVLGVRHARCPNGIGRKLHCYAIAEWQLAGSRCIPVRDLVTQLRLANQVEHPFPKNPEPYANDW